MTYRGSLPNLVRLYEFKLDQNDSFSPFCLCPVPPPPDYEWNGTRKGAQIRRHRPGDRQASRGCDLFVPVSQSAEPHEMHPCTVQSLAPFGTQGSLLSLRFRVQILGKNLV